MVRGKGSKILSISEREGLIDEKNDLERELKNAQSPGAIGSSADRLDQNSIKMQIAKLDKEIVNGAAPKVRGATKDALKAEADALLEKIIVGMPSRYEMDNPGKCPGAVHKHMNWDRKTQAWKERFKIIMRTIEPEDPTAADIERYRKDK
jgi:hypothetical protein